MQFAAVDTVSGFSCPEGRRGLCGISHRHTVESLKCDVLVAAHPELSDLWERKAKQPALGDAAFIDKDACRNYAAKARAWLAQTLADDTAAAQTGKAK